jgi:putative autoinducer-2 (AI-2) aldolase
VNLGRNIWQHDCPVAMMRAIRHIVHESGTVASAYDLFQTVQAEASQESRDANEA